MICPSSESVQAGRNAVRVIGRNSSSVNCIPQRPEATFLVPNKGAGRHVSFTDAGPMLTQSPRRLCPRPPGSQGPCPGVPSTVQHQGLAPFSTASEASQAFPDPSRLAPDLLSTHGGHSPALGPNGLHPSPDAPPVTADLSQVYLSGPRA